METRAKEYPGADPGFLKGGGGVQIRSTSKKGGARRGSNFGPNVKKPTPWHKRGGVWTPLWIRYSYRPIWRTGLMGASTALGAKLGHYP